jgi:hypothetical protein
MNTDKQVRQGIADIWTQVSTEMGESIRVIPRWKLSLKGKELMAGLRSANNDKLVNGVYITRIQNKRKKVHQNHFELKWTYAMMYFRSYDDTSDANNSEDKLNLVLDKVADKFSNNPGISNTLTDVDNHEEFQVENIDTIDLRVNAAQCLLIVNLTQQP